MSAVAAEWDLPIILRRVRIALKRYRWTFTGMLIATILAFGAFTGLEVPIYRAEAQVMVELRSSPLRNYAMIEVDFIELSDRLNAQKALAKSRPVLVRAAELAGPTTLGPESGRDILVRGTLLIFHVNHSNAERAKLLANAWTDAFIEISNQRSIKMYGYTKDVLNQKIPELRKSWMDKQEILLRFLKEANFEPHEIEGGPIFRRYAALSDKLTEARVRESGLLAEAQAWQTGASDPKRLEHLARSRKDEKLLAMDRLILQERRAYAEILTRFAPQSLEAAKSGQNLKQLEELRQEELLVLVGQVEMEFKKAQIEVQQLETALKVAEVEYNQLKGKAATHQLHVFERDMARKQYEELAQLQSQADVAGQIETHPVQLLESADTPGAPFTPNWPRRLLLGLMVGFLLASSTVFVLEILDDSVRTSEMLSITQGLNVLGSVPLLEPRWQRMNTYMLAQDHPQAPPLQSLNSLRGSLLLAMGEDMPSGKLILITSSMEGEGKTFIASNLATMLAGMNKRTLIVDADLFRTQMTSALGLKGSTGLKAQSRLTNWKEHVQSAGMPNLDILPAETTRDITGSTLESTGLFEILEDLRSAYDFVILDSPPMLAVADARLLASRCDASLVIVRSRMTSVKMVEFSNDLIRKSKPKHLFYVVNGVNEDDSFASGYQYAYTYSAKPGLGSRNSKG